MSQNNKHLFIISLYGLFFKYESLLMKHLSCRYSELVQWLKIGSQSLDVHELILIGKQN